MPRRNDAEIGPSNSLHGYNTASIVKELIGFIYQVTIGVRCFRYGCLKFMAVVNFSVFLGRKCLP